MAAGLLVAVSIAAVWMRGGSSDQLVSWSYEEYFGSFSADYDPAGTRTDLASRSELVVEATLVDVIDGPVFGSSATDPSASKHALFVFEAESTRDPIAVMLQRPNTSDIEALRDAMPIGGRAVLYLVAVPSIPDNERDFWFNVDDGLARWYPTTPQGLILERASDDGTPAHVAGGAGLRSGSDRAKIEHVFPCATIGQRSLFGSLEPEYDPAFTELTRLDLDDRTWVDHVPAWLQGSDQVFDELTSELPFRQRTGVRMYDQIVDEPRLSAWWSVASGRPEPMLILREIRLLLADRYDEPFDSIGFNLYRDGSDSVAWHGDRHRHVVTNPVIAIVSVGAPRPLKLRPRGGGSSLSWSLGNGDLFVMGGACQHEWEHTVPKVRSATGPRLSITFRSV